MTTPPEDRTEVTLRRALAAMVPDDTDAQAEFDELVSRLSINVLAPPAPPTLRRHRRSWVGVAAAAAVLAVVAGAAVARERDRGGDVVANASEPAATGWYVPEGLGKEWTLESVGSDFRDVEPAESCPCQSRVWTGPDGDTSVVAYSSGDDNGLSADLAFDPDEPVRHETLAPGVTATVGGYLRGDAALWLHGGRRWFVFGVGASNEDVLDAARVVASDPSSDAAPLDGFDLTTASETDGGLRSYESVQVVVRNTTTGHRVSYVLSPPGRGEDPGTVLVPHRLKLNGSLPWVLAYPADAEIDQGSNATRFLAHWPGADVSANGDASFGAPPSSGTEGEVRKVIGSLRPASAEEWAAFLQTATGMVEGDPPLDTASLADLTQE